jgi:tight adherence protein C
MSPVLAFAAAGLSVLGLAELLGPLAARARQGALRARPGARERDGPRALALLARAGGRLRAGAAPAPRDLDARIAAAGRPGGLGAREVMAAKVAAALAGALIAATLSALAPGRLGAALVVAGPLGGFLAPDLWLARRAEQRARRMRRELPALLELLRVGVEAGSSLPEALREVAERSRGPLAREWRSLAREVRLGVPLESALAGLARRAPLPEVHALVAALERARRHGVPLAETLAAQSRDVRFALARHAREEAARAGPKIQLVVALLLVPSVLLLVAAALIAALGDGKGGAMLPV